MYRVGRFGSVLLTALFLISPRAFADEGGAHLPGTHMKVSGVVSKIQSGVVFVKTTWGQMRLQSAFPGGLENIEVGEELDMQVNENNTVIDVRRKGEPAQAHRYVTGDVAYASAGKQEIKLWTPEGEKTFPVVRNRSKLTVLEEGKPVTVELNKAGNVVDVHPGLTVEMSIDQRPRTAPGHHMTVRGEVTKIQSGVIYVKTAAARYTVSANSAPSDAKVGDQVTLWLNEENMVIDHHRTGHGKPHRLVTGKLIYAGLTKKEIKLRTPEGEKVFPLERMEVKTKPIEEGSLITVELNEDETVVDLRKAEQ